MWLFITWLICTALNVLMLLTLTLLVAALTLVERKILALLQRRVGPYHVGFRGRLQYIADALKLFLKNVTIPTNVNKFFFVITPSIAGATCYSFWINSVWGPSVSIFELEYNIVVVGILSILFSLCIVLGGFFSNNKYSMLAAVRTCIITLNLELFLGVFFLNLVLLTESFNLNAFVIYQEEFWFIIPYFSLLGCIILIFLLETSRAPFDLAEAESELVAGYTVEFGGFFFGLFYLGEYLHLFFFSLMTATLVLGGWELPNFLSFFIQSEFSVSN